MAEKVSKGRHIYIPASLLSQIEEYGSPRNLSSSKAATEILRLFFESFQDDKFSKNMRSNSIESNKHLNEDIKKLSKKVDFIRALFTGTILDLVESSVLVKEASWNSQESIRAAEETRDYYDKIIEKYSVLVEEK